MNFLIGVIIGFCVYRVVLLYLKRSDHPVAKTTAQILGGGSHGEE
jgi:hypothetical protein